MARRIAIIDHNEHELLIEDINEQELEEKYGGDEQKYIDNNYDLENYSWEWIVETDYIPSDDATPIEIDFENI
jgi:hypothetical protein